MKVYPFRCPDCSGTRFFLLLGTMHCWTCNPSPTVTTDRSGMTPDDHAQPQHNRPSRTLPGNEG